jgi:hypothetical protein
MREESGGGPVGDWMLEEPAEANEDMDLEVERDGCFFSGAGFGALSRRENSPIIPVPCLL